MFRWQFVPLLVWEMAFRAHLSGKWKTDVSFPGWGLCFVVLYCSWVILAIKLVLDGSFLVLHRWLYLHWIQ